MGMNNICRISGGTWAIIAVSLAAPIVTSLIVIELLVGIANLKVHYWLTDGMIISLVLNGIGAVPLLNDSIRKRVSSYVKWLALVVSLMAFAGYGIFMVALVGV
jgi:hypothetical protein